MNKDLLTPKTFIIDWDTHFINTKITVTTPDLENLQVATEGDWGPMYKFALDAKNLPRITYLDKKTEFVDSYLLDDKVLYIESPILASVRQETPFIYKITDERKGIDIHFFMDQNHTLKEYWIVRSEDKVNLYKKITAEEIRSIS